MLATMLSRTWWTLLLRGALWILFGLLTFSRPLMTLVTLTLLFGVFVLADGVWTVVGAVAGREEHEHWWVLLLTGLCGIVAGALTLVSPGLTAVILLLYVAAWAIVTGVLEVMTAVRLRAEIEGEGWFVLAGIASIAFGVLLLARPAAGVLSALWLLATYALVYGVLLVVLAFRARRFAHRVDAILGD